MKERNSLSTDTLNVTIGLPNTIQETYESLKERIKEL